MLDAYRWALSLGAANGIVFSEMLRNRVASANHWLAAMIDDATGQAPNLGSNDGACILPIASNGYLNYRDAISPAITDSTTPYRSEYFPDGGYAVIPHDHGKLIVRCPTHFRHRPSQCDLLHLDLWHRGINILRDAGTYSYNCAEPWQTYFRSTTAHNTVEFDGHDQMPKIGRFLYGAWPHANVISHLSGATPSVTSDYTDWKGCHHERRITLHGDTIEIADKLSGFTHKAVLHWHLSPAQAWTLHENECRSESCTLQLFMDNVESPPLAWGKGWESLYYMAKETVPTLQLTVTQPCILRTVIHLI
jgi:hypothetical protein